MIVMGRIVLLLFPRVIVALYAQLVVDRPDSSGFERHLLGFVALRPGLHLAAEGRYSIFNRHLNLISPDA